MVRIINKNIEKTYIVVMGNVVLRHMTRKEILELNRNDYRIIDGTEVKMFEQWMNPRDLKK